MLNVPPSWLAFNALALPAKLRMPAAVAVTASLLPTNVSSARATCVRLPWFCVRVTRSAPAADEPLLSAMFARTFPLPSVLMLSDVVALVWVVV